jgi:integrase
MSGHIRARGKNSWELRYPAPRGPDGRRRTATTTFHGTKKAAAAKLRELMGAVDRGQHVPANKITVAELTSERIEVWRAAGDITAKTREAYLAAAGLINTHLGAIAAQRLTTRDVEQWHLAMRGRGLASATIRKAHAILVRALAEGKRHKVVPQNVAQEQGLPKLPPAAKIKVLKDDQIDPLLEALMGSEFHAPAALTIFAGARRGEMLALQWSDIDLAAATMTISRALEEVGTTITFKPPKTKAGARTVSLPSKAV